MFWFVLLIVVVAYFSGAVAHVDEERFIVMRELEPFRGRPKSATALVLDPLSCTKLLLTDAHGTRTVPTTAVPLLVPKECLLERSLTLQRNATGGLEDLGPGCRFEGAAFGSAASLRVPKVTSAIDSKWPYGVLDEVS